jgi:hypothetical protein
MPASNYPFDQDRAFNSFVITDPTTVTGILGKTYAQSELVPVNYSRLMQRALSDASITWFPVQEFVYIADSDVIQKFQDETTSDIQGVVLKLAMADLYNYWKTQLLSNSTPAWTIPLNAPMIVVTPHASQVHQDIGIGASNFHLVLRFDVLTFVLPTSIYA